MTAAISIALICFSIGVVVGVGMILIGIRTTPEPPPESDRIWPGGQ